MAQTTAIEWTDLSWNPTHGCSKVSPGCAHCYAETLSRRYHQTPKAWTPGNAAENITVKPHKLREPLSNARAWRGLGAAAAAAGKTDGKLVFVNSMSDLFHEEVPDEFIARVFAAMALAQRYTFQVLTKRPERMRRLLASEAFWREVAAAVLFADFDVPKRMIEAARARLRAGRVQDGPREGLANVWLGVSIENRRFVGRADELRETPAAVRFISAEPLLGPLLPSPSEAARRGWPSGQAWADDYAGVGLNLLGIDWLIVGGESGPRHRPMREEWVRDLRDACACRCGPIASVHCPRACRSRGGTAFFFKQWGGPRPGGEALLDGREWREFPQVGA